VCPWVSRPWGLPTTQDRPPRNRAGSPAVKFASSQIDFRGSRPAHQQLEKPSCENGWQRNGTRRALRERCRRAADCGFSRTHSFLFSPGTCSCSRYIPRPSSPCIILFYFFVLLDLEPNESLSCCFLSRLPSRQSRLMAYFPPRPLHPHHLSLKKKERKKRALFFSCTDVFFCMQGHTADIFAEGMGPEVGDHNLWCVLL
jgi:hypothetical protein